MNREFDTWRGPKEFYRDEWLRPWITPQNLAWLIALLRECLDDPELFTHGKWALIQEMERRLAEAARAELPLTYTMEGVKQ